MMAIFRICIAFEYSRPFGTHSSALTLRPAAARALLTSRELELTPPLSREPWHLLLAWTVRRLP
jgi:hypothetical protein